MYRSGSAPKWDQGPTTSAPACSLSDAVNFAKGSYSPTFAARPIVVAPLAEPRATPAVSDHPTSKVPLSDELAMRRTGMAFQRTRMAADRTLMAVIRTSLSLITFGFTLYQVFKRLATAHLLGDTAGTRHFGTALVLLGIAMLVLGVIYHVMFMLALRAQRRRMRDLQLIYAESGFPASLTLIIAVLLLLLGIYAAISILT